MNNKQENREILTQAPYLGASPKRAAFSEGAATLAILAPIYAATEWVLSGVGKLWRDKAMENIPFKERTWSRFKRLEWNWRDDWITSAALGALMGYQVYQSAKRSYEQASHARDQHQQLVAQTDILADQLKEFGQTPRYIQGIKRVQMPTDFIHKANKAPSEVIKVFDSHAERVSAEKQESIPDSPSR